MTYDETQKLIGIIVGELMPWIALSVFGVFLWFALMIWIIKRD